MDVARTIPPRIRWPEGIEAIKEWDGLDGLERPEGLADRMRLTLAPDRPQLLKSEQWSLNYDSCQECGTIAIRHGGRGLCRNCYMRIWIRQKREPMPSIVTRFAAD